MLPQSIGFAYNSQSSSNFQLSEAIILNSSVAAAANLLLILGLVVYGFTLFADYSARGRWAKNVTSLLASLGILTLALALALTPENSALLFSISQTSASRVLLGVSSFLLLLSMGAFGLITYSRPFRLRHEKTINRHLNRDLPKIP
jgi:magnesium-transporting ATPase (P-type)